MALVREIWKRLDSDDCADLAAQLSFYFVVATLGFNFCVAHGSSISKIYGALAGFLVLVLWIFAVNLMLLIGAETDTTLRERRPHEAGA